MLTHLYALGYLGVFLITFVESIGIPVPSAIAFLTAIAILESESATPLTPYLLFATLVIGQLSGSLVGYGIGIRGSGWLLTKIKSSIKFQKTYATVQRISKKYGIFAVILARLCGYIRP